MYVPVSLRDGSGGGGGGASSPVVTQVNSFGSVRSDFSGWVGFQFLVGPNALTVTELGRWVISGNSGNHVVKLFYSDGTAVPNGSVTVSTAGKPAGQFAYATLSTPVVLAPGTYYEVMSQETSGSDTWYDYSGTAITMTGDANSAWAMWAYNNPPPYYGAVGGSGKSYGPVNLRYSTDQEEGDFILAGETRYIYDGMRVVQERDENNTPTVSYTRGLDLSGTQEGAGGIGGLLARSDGYSSGTWTTHYYYHADGGGNITYMINGSEGMAAQYRYDPFGRTLYTDGPLAEANVYRFSSKEFLQNAGFYYYGFRFYDSGTQRWMNRDPIQEWGALNLYEFSYNKPIGLVDRDGRECLDYYQTPDGQWTCKAPDFNPAIRDPIGGLLNYLFGGGQAMSIEWPLSAALQNLQNAKPWPVTTSPVNMTICDYGSWKRPFSTLYVWPTLGQFRYTNNGTNTSVFDVYTFPFTQTNWNGEISHHNAPLSWIPGIPYPVSGSWQTPGTFKN